jgi:hypothetical protein
VSGVAGWLSFPLHGLMHLFQGYPLIVSNNFVVYEQESRTYVLIVRRRKETKSSKLRFNCGSNDKIIKLVMRYILPINASFLNAGLPLVDDPMFKISWHRHALILLFPQTETYLRTSRIDICDGIYRIPVERLYN